VGEPQTRAESVLRSVVVARVIFRLLRFVMTIVVAAAVVWYAWALIPSIHHPPGVGKLFTKHASSISKLASELHVTKARAAKVPVPDVEKACDVNRFLRPLEGPPDHVVLLVTNGLVTIERNVSCKTHEFSGPWRKAP
jgi:hypothetical protein